MEARFDFAKAAPGVPRALAVVEQYLRTCGMEEGRPKSRAKARELEGTAAPHLRR
jgi:hypothetical protein